MPRTDTCLILPVRVVESGFTFIWVLLLVALLSLSVSVALETDETETRREKERELLSIGRQFKVAMASYVAVNPLGGPDAYPRELTDLLLDERTGVRRRHLRKLFVDPMTGKQEWGVVRAGGRIVGIYSTSSQSPLKVQGFDEYGFVFKQPDRYSGWIFSYP